MEAGHVADAVDVVTQRLDGVADVADVVDEENAVDEEDAGPQM
jgi:hypothetical protein